MSIRATFQIDPAHLAQRIAAVRAQGRLRPRALIGVDLFGQPADWPALSALAPREDLFTLDDLRAELRLHPARRAGSARRRTRRRPASSPRNRSARYGDGGALFTESAERAALFRSLRTHGEGTTRYEVLRTGMNGRLDTLQAAVLLAKLSVFPEELAAREQVARFYDRRLGHLLEIPARVADSTSAWAIYAVLLADAAQRDHVQVALRAAGVPTAIYYPRPLHQQPAYRAAHDGTALPVAEASGGAHPGAADPSRSDRNGPGAYRGSVGRSAVARAAGGSTVRKQGQGALPPGPKPRASPLEPSIGSEWVGWHGRRRGTPRRLPCHPTHSEPTEGSRGRLSPGRGSRGAAPPWACFLKGEPLGRLVPAPGAR